MIRLSMKFVFIFIISLSAFAGDMSIFCFDENEEIFIGVPLAAFRFHGESKTVGGRSKQTEEYEQVMLDRVLHLKRNRFSLAYLRTVVRLFRFKNMLLRGLCKLSPTKLDQFS